MKSEIKKTIEKGLKNYPTKTVRIKDGKYTLYVFSKDEDINIFEGFIFAEVEDKSELMNFNKYKAPVSGYTPRMALILYKNKFIIKDYRRNRQILKTVHKVNDTFLKKLRKALAEHDEDNFNKLFDRTDIIEEFYVLYKKSRNYLLKNITGISGEGDREEFVDNLMLQMLTLWYLQERGFFNNDSSYFITKFDELKQKKLTGDVNSYYEFLRYLFDKISSNVDEQHHEDDITGKVVVVGPAIFINGKQDAESISVPEKCFYKDGMTKTLIDIPPKKVSADVPLLNLFESRDWTEGNIDEFVLGALYEKLITQDVRKKTGAYYTPEEITSYICKNTIEPYLIDRVNEKWNMSFESMNQVIDDGDKKILLHLFEQLKEIKILDPAVGSAHFLESAINVLLDVYEKIWDKAKEIGMRKGLEIKASDESGNIRDINLLEISNEEQFRLYVKFFIILSKNIYGVDINRSALKVAKARLFLTLAKHFDASKNYFIRFPNVHFNLRSGNSLIGYVELKDKPKGQTTFDMFINEDDALYVKECIRVVSELKCYLNETAKALGISGDIVKEVSELNKTISKETIDWFDFERLLRTKEKLIKILIVSLNSEYASPLNELLYQITNLFNCKLDAKFADEYGIDPHELAEIQTFHWLFEFPEVFMDWGGFDVVVGNPPYLRQESIGIEKQYFERLYPDVYEGTADLCVYFIKKSIDVTIDEGYHSFIITNKWLRARYGKKIRKYLAKDISINRLVDFNGVRVFKGATIDVLLYTIKKSKEGIGDIYNSSNLSSFAQDISNVSSIDELINKNLIIVNQKTLNEEWNLVSKEVVDIKKWIDKKGIKLKDMDIKIYRGILTGFNEAFIIDNATRNELIQKDSKSKEFIKPILRGKEIEKYRISWDKKHLLYIPWHFDIEEYPAIKEHLMKFKINLENRNKAEIGIRYEWYALQRYAANYCEEFEHSKIIYPVIGRGNFAVDMNGFMVNDKCFLIPSKNETFTKFILMMLSSKTLEFYFKSIGAKLGSVGYEYRKIFVELLPILHISEPLQNYYEIVADYLLFLNQLLPILKNDKLKHIETYFDDIVDYLVYELYFNQKFYQDDLYPKPELYLLDIVSKHLKPIDYDFWSTLYWKNQLEDGLTATEAKEFDVLEEANLRTIEHMYDVLNGDVEVQEWVDRIKGHEWVKIIETSINGK